MRVRFARPFKLGGDDPRKLTVCFTTLRRSRLLDLVNLYPHPLLKCRFQFRLIVLSFQILNRLTGFIQRNVMARDLFRLMLSLDKIHQATLTASVIVIRVGVV